MTELDGTLGRRTYDELTDEALIADLKKLYGNRQSREEYASNHHGERTWILEAANVMPGLVVNGDFNHQVWEKIHDKSVALLLIPDQQLPSSEVEKILAELYNRFKREVMYLFIADDKNWLDEGLLADGFSVSPIFVGDLSENPDVLKQQSRVLKDPVLAEMKRVAFLAITGTGVQRLVE